ncbi:hypothetical protein [Bradyrhizobium centrolobii]|nr:hypothetical protein [Bradyrhizobium centrolobii]
MTLAGDFGFDDTDIARCLDQAVTKKGDAIVADRHRQSRGFFSWVRF